MTEQQFQALEPALADFLDRFLFCCDYTQTFAHLGTYVRGLLSDLPRKSVEPIALQAGTPVRTLQEFLKDHTWDFGQVRQRLQGDAAALRRGLESILSDPARWRSEAARAAVAVAARFGADVVAERLEAIYREVAAPGGAQPAAGSGASTS